MKRRYISLLAIIMLSTSPLFSQEQELTPYGNIRFAYFGNTDEASGIGGNDFFGVRLRYGLKFQLNENSSFSARMVGQFRDDTNELRFTFKADGGGLDPGSISFDELYYQFKSESSILKIGRFQQSVPVLTNAQRSSIRFQSNVIFVHWSDGIYYQREINDEWYGEIIAEYQQRSNTTYPYHAPLTFGNSSDNITTYLGVENRERDNFNIIQKGFGLFIAPNSVLKNTDYTNYIGLMSRLAIDIPKKDLLDGGSIRIGAELSQNIATDIADGTNAIISAGINRYAGKHDFMIEFSRTDRDWLTATTYAPNNDELELRYKIHLSNKFNIDARYRVRVPDSGATYAYSTFIRATYSFN